MSRLLLPLLLVVAGCTKVWPVNKNPYAVSTSPVASSQFEVIGPVSVKQCNKLIIVIPILKDPSLLFDELVAEAQKVGGVAVTGVEFRQVDLLTAPLYVRNCIEASGLAVKMKAAPPPPPPPPPPPATKKKK